MDPEFVKTLENLADVVANYAEQEAVKWLNSQKKVGTHVVPMSGEEKKEIAVKALQSVAPPGMSITPEQANIAIEAAVFKKNSFPPPAGLSPLSPLTIHEGTSLKSLHEQLGGTK